MAESSPPPSSSGNAKYIVIAVLFALAGVVLFFAMKPPAPPVEPVAVAETEPAPTRSTALATQEFELPEEQPEDAGEPDAEAVAPVKRQARDTWDCSGEIPAAAARDVIRLNQRQVRSCYERRLKVINTLQGTLQVQVRIGADGAVTGLRRAGGTFRDNETFSCVRQLAQSWRFPAPTGGRCAVMVAPFNFTPSS